MSAGGVDTGAGVLVEIGAGEDVGGEVGDAVGPGVGEAAGAAWTMMVYMPLPVLPLAPRDTVDPAGKVRK